MRVLLCTFASPGYLFASLRLALSLRERGHEVTFFTDAADLVHDAGFPCASGEAEGTFDPSDWFRPETIVGHFTVLNRVIREQQPSLILTHQLMLGAILSARQQHIALGVIGLAAPIFPLSEEHLEHARMTGARAAGRYSQLLEIYQRAAAGLGLMPAQVSPDYFTGEAFFLRSAPELELDAARLPAHVHFVGDLWWEPPSWDEDLAAFLERARALEQAVVFVQPGRTFDEASFTQALTRHLGERGAVVIDTLRSDEAGAITPTSNVWVGSYVPMGMVLPQAALMVSHAHTTAALAGLRFGVPHLVSPNGSGTEDIAQRLVAVGAARCAHGDRLIIEGAVQLLHETPDVPVAVRTALHTCGAPDTVFHTLEGLG